MLKLLRRLRAALELRRWRALCRPGRPFADVRPLTRGPNFHWFGYYDKAEMDPTGRYVLGNEVTFELRDPTPEDSIRVGMADLQDGDRWIELGTSRAWSWQQGCMLQWRPGSASEVLWNDVEDGAFVCRSLDIGSGKTRTLPAPIYHVTPDGREAVGLDFARLHHLRPGYGYAAVPDPRRGVPAPADSTIYRLDLDSGERTDLISVADIAGVPYRGADPAADFHYFNHLQWNPTGQRFLFYDLWKSPRTRGGPTRAFTAARDGSDLRLLSDRRSMSHYEWRDADHLLVYRRAYRLFTDDGSGRETLLWRAPNGHQTSLPGNEWVLTDAYPLGPERMQDIYLYHLPTREVVLLGRFQAAPAYLATNRCDLHPRVCAGGRWVVFDSTHAGTGRQMYMMDLSGYAGL